MSSAGNGAKTTVTSKTPRSLDLLRLVGGVVLLSLGLVAVLPAVNDRVWQLSVLVTEGGHWPMVACLPLFAPGWRRTRVGWAGVGLGLLGTMLLLTPLARAVAVSRELPGALETCFADLGPMTPAATPRRVPLVAQDLFIGVSSPAVRVEDHLFGSVGGQKLRLDLYRPAEDHPPLPGVVVIHGGSWQSGSRKDFPALNRYLAARGYLVAAVSYRFSPRFRFPAARDDVAAAIAFLKRNGGRLGLDASRLALVGRAAGGQLALVVAYTTRDPAIKGVVSYYGGLRQLSEAVDHRFERPPRRLSGWAARDARVAIPGGVSAEPHRSRDATHTPDQRSARRARLAVSQ